jgi:hypothetical protein
LPSASAPNTRQRRCLCRVSTRALGTGTGGGAHWTSLCREPYTRQNWPLCRVPQNALGKGSVTVTWRRNGDFSLPSAKWHSAKSLPSARQKVLGKEAVADVQFAERSLPSVTLGLCRVSETHGKGADSGSEPYLKDHPIPFHYVITTKCTIR